MTTSSTLWLECASLPGLGIQTMGTDRPTATLRMIRGSWTTAVGDDGTAVESFEAFGQADDAAALTAISRRINAFATAAADANSTAAVTEVVWLHSRAMGEVSGRRARVLSIVWSVVDDAIVDSTFYNKAGLWRIAITRTALWENESYVPLEWKDVAATPWFHAFPNNPFSSAPEHGIVESFNLFGSGDASFTDIYAGFKSGVGRDSNIDNYFSPTILTKNFINRVGDDSVVARYGDASTVEIHFAPTNGGTQRTDHKPRFTVPWNEWNTLTSSTAAALQSEYAWQQYAGKYHLLCRYFTIAPPGTSTTVPMFSLSGINILAVGSWVEKLPIQYVTHTNGSWRWIDLGIVTIGGGVTRPSAELVSYTKTEIGVSAGYPAAASGMTVSQLKSLYSTHYIGVRNMALIPASNYIHVKSAMAIGEKQRLLVTSDGVSAPLAYVTERQGLPSQHLSTISTNTAPFAVIQQAEVESENWTCPPWDRGGLVLLATRPGQSGTEQASFSMRIRPRTGGATR